MRILWISNAPWAHTGYGVQTMLVCRALRDMGHDVAIFGFYGMEGAIGSWEGITIYPDGPAPYGNSMLRGHASQHDAELVISLMDVWVQEKWGVKLARDGRKFVPWLPIDMSPAPKRVVDALEGVTWCLPFSQFGLLELNRAGVENAGVMPLGFDGRVYRPGDQVAARKALKLPEGRFIVGMVAANRGDPGRKCFPEQLLAFREFQRQRPDAWLYLHTLASPVETGIDIEALLANLGLHAGEDYGLTNQYEIVCGWPENRMAELFQAMDVLSSASMGEGFGVPIVEAQACGTPVVTAWNSAMPELTWSGHCVSRQHAYWTTLNAWCYMPEPDAITDAYLALYDQLHGSRAGELKEQAVAGAAPYEIMTLARTHWAPLLDRIARL